MSTFAVTYRYTDDVALRDEVRPRHREYLGGVAAADVLLLAGAFGPDGALLVLRCPDERGVHDVVGADPFHTSGVLDSYDVVPWAPVLGALVPALESAAVR